MLLVITSIESEGMSARFGCDSPNAIGRQAPDVLLMLPWSVLADSCLMYVETRSRGAGARVACSLAAEQVRSLGAISGSLSPFVFFSSIPYSSRYSRDAPNGRCTREPGARAPARHTRLGVPARAPTPRARARRRGGDGEREAPRSNCRISNFGNRWPVLGRTSQTQSNPIKSDPEIPRALHPASDPTLTGATPAQLELPGRH